VARDPETIQREIEKSRDALVQSVDALVDRTNPKRLADQAKQSVVAKLEDPKIKYGLIAVGAIVGLAILRQLFK
jgi:predicted dinucleotide-utilizing enzyme